MSKKYIFLAGYCRNKAVSSQTLATTGHDGVISSSSGEKRREKEQILKKKTLIKVPRRQEEEEVK